MSSVRLPWIPAWFVSRTLPHPWAGELLGEMRTAFVRDVRARGSLYARWRFWREAFAPATLRLRSEARLGGPRHRSPQDDRSLPERGIDLVAHLLQDIRFAIRGFARNRTFALTAVLIVGLGIGATTVIFTVVDNVLLRQLPYRDPEQLVFFDHGAHTVPQFLAWTDRTRSFAAVGAVMNREINLTQDGEPSQLRAALVSADLFGVFEARTNLGRLFSTDEYVDPAATVVLGQGIWQRRWGSDPEILGRSLIIDGVPHVVIGVMAPGFAPPEAAVGNHVDMWLPFDARNPERLLYNHYVLSVVARLHPGTGIPTAQAELDGLSIALAEEDPEHFISQRTGEPRPFPIVSLLEATVGAIGPTLYMLMGAVAMMLLIACANVANLFLARGTERRREMALRSAIGARGRRLVSQLLTESVVLALAGGLVGLIIALVGVHGFGQFAPSGIPRAGSIAIDYRILAFQLLVASLTGVVFGLLPALQAARTDVGETLKEGITGAGGDRRRGRLRGFLVVSEIALALVLLIGAGLLFNSFVRLNRVDPGFDTENLLTMPLRLTTFEPAERTQVIDRILTRVRSLPAVEQAGMGLTVPFVFTGSSRCCWMDRLLLEGEIQEDDPSYALINAIEEGYFEALGARLRHGRNIRPDDGSDRLVALLNVSTSQRLFGTDNAVGKTFRIEEGEVTVAGVVEDIRHWGLGQEIEDEVYVPYRALEAWFRDIHIVARVRGEATGLAADLRQAVWSVAPDLPVMEVITMRQRVSDSMAEPRFLSGLLVGFSALALALAAGGIYGSLLYMVGQRRREMGIRMALGAETGSVLRLVMRQGAVLTATGIAVGCVGALLLSRTLESMVFGITTTDPGTFLTVAAILAAAALAACYQPARRAARTDPMQTLRSD